MRLEINHIKAFWGDAECRWEFPQSITRVHPRKCSTDKKTKLGGDNSFHPWFGFGFPLIMVGLGGTTTGNIENPSIFNETFVENFELWRSYLEGVKFKKDNL